MIPAITQSNVRIIQDLRHPQLRLIVPLYATVEEEGDVVVASNAALDVFGYGDTEAEALQDLRETIVETYFDLRNEADQLGPHLQKVWQYLDRDRSMTYEDYIHLLKEKGLIEQTWLTT